MITNFETITADLTPQQKKGIKYLARIMKGQRGKDNAIIGRHISERLAMAGVKAWNAELRKLINLASTTGAVRGICACEKGYYIANDIGDLYQYFNSLADRIRAIQARLSSTYEDIKFSEDYLKKTGRSDVMELYKDVRPSGVLDKKDTRPEQMELFADPDKQFFSTKGF